MVLVQILMLTSSYAIAKIIGVVFIYFFTRQLNRSFKREHGIIAYSAPEEIQESMDEIEKIVAIDFIANSDEIALVKGVGNQSLFIEIVDADLNHKETISLADEIFNTHKFNKFQCLPDRHFYFNMSVFQAEKWNKWHLKIDFYGNIFFEEDSFDYNRSMGDPIDLFCSSDYKRLSLCYFFKDEEEPRGNFSVFNIEDYENPELISSLKIDDKKGFVIQYVILKLEEFSITLEKRINIKYGQNVFGHIYFLINQSIVKVDYNKIRIRHIETNENKIIPRDEHSPYCSNENTLVYLNNHQLEKLSFS
ncbi:hypothetical protein G7074_23370 [Pedobacter sp. HDW13]|uniref:hypothetical protein n=1 Tax=Pedobacter sp. HDW13 TaxID=2714940 RepID=UPI00140856ED|nr:hypothetical protein [Pedobacter sp. HDW13]QIL41947.1 hypothetical protein G7074_23370 [Pedobacter sp. HDW13]